MYNRRSCTLRWGRRWRAARCSPPPEVGVWLIRHALGIHISHPFISSSYLIPSINQPPIPQSGSRRNMEEMRAACKEFITVWPAYIDQGKTIPEGRRIPKERACE